MTLALNPINPISNSDYVITSPEIGATVYWTEFSGIKATYTRSEFNDGLSQLTRTASGGNKKYESVTISKPYDPDTDGPVDTFVKAYEGGEAFTLTLSPVRFTKNGGTREANKSNKGWSLTGCRLLSWACAENINTDEGGTTLKYTLEFSVEQATPL